MRKGFTLIETMAVLIIITVILLITVPIVNYIIKEVKKESFKVGARLVSSQALQVKTIDNNFDNDVEI